MVLTLLPVYSTLPNPLLLIPHWFTILMIRKTKQTKANTSYIP